MKLNPMLMLRVMPDQSGVVFDPENNCAMHLNKLGVVVWKALEKESDAKTIVAGIAARFGIPEAQAQTDFDAFIAELKRRKLLALENA